MWRNNIQSSGLSAISAKTLVIGGNRDQFFVKTMQVTYRAILNAELETFGSETHTVPLERAQEVKARLAEFLAQR